MREHRSISIADQIFEQLERDILSGKYPRGEILSEESLEISEENFFRYEIWDEEDVPDSVNEHEGKSKCPPEMEQ